MTAAATRKERLIERLPKVRGRYTENAALDRITWFRVGGPAEILFKPADRADLIAFLQARPADVALTVIGVGSNLLVRDGGVDGVVIRLGGGFGQVSFQWADDRALIETGAGALDFNVAHACRLESVTGLEFLSGVPGTIGGALRMNAGAYDSDMATITLGADALAPDGTLHTLDAAQLGFAYRHSAVPEDWIFLAARLQGRRGEAAAIAQRMAEIAASREASQPIRTRTGGSTFKNPRGPEAKGKRAWDLIEAAGCRGLARGAAQVSEKHCNFLINRGGASAADIEGLGEEVRRRVFEATGVTLEWEIRRIGRHDGEPGPRVTDGSAG
jgi:UDP-N-acetylmuramate dehydrogenase